MKGKPKRHLSLSISLTTLDTQTTSDHIALLDSGATAMFIHEELVKEKGYVTRQLQQPIPVYNADNTTNVGGYITHEVDLIMKYKDHREKATFEVCNLGKQRVILGHSWLSHHNPEIDWELGTVHMTRCPRACRSQYQDDQRREESEIPNDHLEPHEELHVVLAWNLLNYHERGLPDERTWIHQ